jgi:hypothetical protein
VLFAKFNLLYGLKLARALPVSKEPWCERYGHGTVIRPFNWPFFKMEKWAKRALPRLKHIQRFPGCIQ